MIDEYFLFETLPPKSRTSPAFHASMVPISRREVSKNKSQTAEMRFSIMLFRTPNPTREKRILPIISGRQIPMRTVNEILKKKNRTSIRKKELVQAPLIGKYGHDWSTT